MNSTLCKEVSLTMRASEMAPALIVSEDTHLAVALMRPYSAGCITCILVAPGKAGVR